jgi:class 3 adenylate cyclase
LISADASFVEPGVSLLITDLHGLIRFGEQLDPQAVHRWMLTWGNLHRQAVAGLKGQVRQFIADMALVTFSDADDAVQAVLNLRTLAARHNQSTEDLPPLHFKAAISTGDLLLTPTGLVGRLVNQTFDLLNATARGTVIACPETYRKLAAYADRFHTVTLGTNRPQPAFQLTE